MRPAAPGFTVGRSAGVTTNGRRHRRPGLPAVLVASLGLAAAGAWPGLSCAAEYRTDGDCDGFPAVTLTVHAPLCMGLVAKHLGYPRGVAAIDHDVFVLDMGGWSSRHGRLLRLPDGGHGAPQVVLRDLLQPSALVRGPGRTLYIGATGTVFQVDPFAAEPARTLREVVTGLPKTGRHPVPALAVGTDGSLFVNVGSASDNCQVPGGGHPDPSSPCPETQEKPPRGAILNFPRRTAPWDATQQAPYARGLRNSMALAILPDGRLVAAVNARDRIDIAAPTLSDATLPHDTLVVVQPGGDYGWPYCYDEQIPSPEYPSADCQHRLAPDALLPAHAAPLGMLIYQGGRLPGLNGWLIIGYHGYRAAGHRIMGLRLDARGRPQGAPLELVGGWDEAPGAHPQGAPVGVFEMEDGSVLVTEDHNGTLLRLSRRPK